MGGGQASCTTPYLSSAAPTPRGEHSSPNVDSASLPALKCHSEAGRKLTSSMHREMVEEAGE